MTRGSAASVFGRTAGLAAITLVQTYWFLQPGPLAFKGLIALIVVISLSRPSGGLLIFAGLAPLSTAIATLCGANGLGGQFLEQIALGVGAGVILHGIREQGRTRTGAPALFMAAVAIASALAMIPAEAAQFSRTFDARSLFHEVLDHQSAGSSALWSPVFAAIVVAECGLLAWSVERIVRRSPHLATSLVLIALAGHAAASTLSLRYLVAAAARTGDLLHALPRLLMAARVNLQTDVNAGASALLLAAIAGMALVDGSRRRRAGIGLLLALAAVGVWITGSRIAIVMGIVAAGTLIWRSSVHAGRRWHRIAAAVALLTLVGGMALTIYNPLGRNVSLSPSIAGRVVMAKLGAQMFKESPVFGIGIGRFFAASAIFGKDELLIQNVGPENAHNNFIQVLAEQGLVGLAALLWWLAVVVVGGARAQVAQPTATRGALLAATLACVGTWLTGHPLLVAEFAFVFFFYCGILAGVTPVVPAVAQARKRWLAGALVAAVLVSLPLRAYVLRDTAELEHRGIALSLWQHDDAQPYREAGATFGLYLPTSYWPVAVPVRRAPGAPDPLVVDVSIQGRLINTLSIEGDAWQTAHIAVPPPDSRRFELIDFVVRPSASAPNVPRVLLRVGKASGR